MIVNAETVGVEDQHGSGIADSLGNGTIIIEVVDHRCGSPINNAKVYVGKHHCMKADSSGYYFAHGVPGGYHNVVVFHLFYYKAFLDSILVIPDRVTEKNVRLIRYDSMNSNFSECYRVKLGESTTARYADSNAVFQVQLSLGSWGWYQRLICIVTIRNKTSEPLRFLIPHIMPLCGDTNKNNLRIYNSRGRQLSIDGVHADYIDHGPLITIDAEEFQSWAFLIDSRFRDFWKPGEYEIEFWYYFNAPVQNTWQGRVNMSRIKYYIEGVDY